MTTAEVTDRAGALHAIERCAACLDEVRALLGDGGYSGKSFTKAVQQKLGATVQVAKRNELYSFAVLPQRWIVERSLAWLEQSRQLWKNTERQINPRLQLMHLAFLNMLLKKLWTASWGSKIGAISPYTKKNCSLPHPPVNALILFSSTYSPGKIAKANPLISAYIFSCHDNVHVLNF